MIKVKEKEGKQAIWQYDSKRDVIITPEEGYTVNAIEYYNGTTEKAPVGIIREEDGMHLSEIPNSFLKSDNSIRVYLVMYDGEMRQTVEYEDITVLPRAQPEDYVQEPDKVLTWHSLDERLKKLEEKPMNTDIIVDAVEEYLAKNPIEEKDPTVPDWAKQPEKPTYTASEVNALPKDTKIPSKTSELQNDSNFVTEDFVKEAVKVNLKIILHPVDTTVSQGETANFQVVALGEDLSYQWQYRSANSSVWRGSSATGSKTTTLSIEATASRNGQSYRCVVTDSEGNTATSNEASIAVIQKQKLIFTGSVEAEYDGSEQKTIEISNGDDGITPHIGENGNWFIGDLDTGVSAGGEGSRSRQLLTEYIHSGNREIYIDSIDWETGVMTTTEPHGLTESTKTIIVPHDENGMHNFTSSLGSVFNKIPYEFRTCKTMIVNVVDEQCLQLGGVTKIDLTTTVNKNVDISAFHFEIPIAWKISGLSSIRRTSHITCEICSYVQLDTNAYVCIQAINTSTGASINENYVKHIGWYYSGNEVSVIPLKIMYDLEFKYENGLFTQKATRYNLYKPHENGLSYINIKNINNTNVFAEEILQKSNNYIIDGIGCLVNYPTLCNGAVIRIYAED